MDKKHILQVNLKNNGGDDWDDVPYEDNAGEPYTHWFEEIKHKPPVYEKQYKEHSIYIETLYFETNDWNERKPCDVGRFSVEEINKGAVAWIITDKFCIRAGTTMKDFIQIIEENGGAIWKKI